MKHAFSSKKLPEEHGALGTEKDLKDILRDDRKNRRTGTAGNAEGSHLSITNRTDV